MLRVLVIIGVVIAAAAAGFFVPRLLQFPSQLALKYKFPDQDATTAAKPIAPNESYACSAVTQAETYENRMDGPTGNASAGKGGDEVTLKVSGDGKGISVELPFDIANGATVSPQPIPITAQDGSYVVASRAEGVDIVTLVFDTATLKAVFSYTGQGMMGIRGRSILIACR